MQKKQKTEIQFINSFKRGAEILTKKYEIMLLQKNAEEPSADRPRVGIIFMPKA